LSRSTRQGEGRSRVSATCRQQSRSSTDAPGGNSAPASANSSVGTCRKHGVTNVHHVGRYEHDILQRSVVHRQEFLDPVVSILALPVEVAGGRIFPSPSDSGPMPARKIHLPGFLTVTTSEKLPFNPGFMRKTPLHGVGARARRTAPSPRRPNGAGGVRGASHLGRLGIRRKSSAKLRWTSRENCASHMCPSGGCLPFAREIVCSFLELQNRASSSNANSPRP
jgi:hypothetical protein